jgi:hypothetical protein
VLPENPLLLPLLPPPQRSVGFEVISLAIN